MPLASGSRLGPYEITASIGAGGMGEVYLAHDTKLRRDVAIKVLPADFAHDHERVARFRREAQLVASLNHTNIAAIYGLEEGPGPAMALVLELVEGEDLSQRLARGAIPVAEAIGIARQIAEGLEVAHDKGIVHRDLKPANIKITKEGVVKILDFGIAKAEQTQPSNLPTAVGVLTEPGANPGTPAYMSPEQAKGSTVDKRTDIWAFGVVVYEMLTGKRAFRKEDASETIASVLRDTLSMDTLPPTTPQRLRLLIERCLDRDLKMRLRDIGEARVELVRIEAGATDASVSSSGVAGIETFNAGRPVPRVARVLPWALFAAVGAVLVAVLLVRSPSRAARPAIPRSMVVLTGTAATLQIQPGASNIALSADGKTLAFVAGEAGGRRLFVRRLDQLQATLLPGTEGASYPFFSPDGQWIAFVASGVLRKIPVVGGAVIGLCEAAWGGGGAWTEDDSIIFPPRGSGGLMWIPAAGGTPVPFGPPTTGITSQRNPQVLPDGKGVLYTENATVSFEGATLVVAPRAGGAAKVVARGGAYFGRYVPGGLGGPARSDGGHLIYIRNGTLFAARFDLDRLEIIGEEAPILEGVATSPESGVAHLAVSREGTLAYVPAAFATARYPIHWMTRDGKASVLLATRTEWANPRFSPDGKKLAIDISDGRQRDIWVYDGARDTLTQLTFDPGADSWPVWTPDGRRIAFASDRAERGVPNMYWVNADGTGEVTRLHESPKSELPLSFHPSGKFLTYTVNTGPANRSDSMILPMEGDAVRGFTPGKPFPFLNTPAAEVYSMFSPDGRWIAYALISSDSDNEVYVRPFQGSGGPWRISAGSGLMPEWSVAGHELLFLDVKTNTIMFANYSVVGASFRADKPQVWQPTSFALLEFANRRFAIHPDGKRLALVAADPSVVQDKVALFFNFSDYLQTLTAGRK